MLVTRNLVVRKAAPGETPLQIAYGAVYIPNVVDSQNDFMRPDEIRKAAHGFLRRGTTDAIDTHHNNVKNGSHVVESFLTKEGDPDFPVPGTWVVGIHVPDPDLWSQIEKGEIGGLSMEVIARRHMGKEVPTRKLKMPGGKATGCTYKTGDHEHTYEIEYGPNGEFLGGRTNEVNGHFHVIKAGKTGVVTEEADDHRHRFSTLEHFDFVGEAEEPVAAAKSEDEDTDEAPLFGDWVLLQKRFATAAAASNGARARSSRPRTVRSREEQRRNANHAGHALRNAGRALRGQPTTDHRTIGQYRSNVRRYENQMAEYERGQAGPSNGRTWVRGFYRSTTRGNRIWVRGHWQN